MHCGGHPVLLALIGASAMGCRGCAPFDGVPTAFVPADALAVVVVPSIEDALSCFRKIQGLALGAQRRQGVRNAAPDWALPLAAWVNKYGRKLQTHGVSTHRGAAFFVSRAGDAVAVVPVHTPLAAERLLNDLLRSALGPRLRLRQSQGSRGDPLINYARASDAWDGREVAWTILKGHLILAFAASSRRDPGAAINDLMRADFSSVATLDAFGRALSELSSSQTLVFVNHVSLQQRLSDPHDDDGRWLLGQQLSDGRTFDSGISLVRVLGLVEAWALGLSVRKQRIALQGVALFNAQQHRRIAPLLEPSERSAPALIRQMGGGALAAATWTLQPAAVVQFVQDLLPPGERRQLYWATERWERRNGLQLRQQLLQLFSGRFALAIYPGVRKPRPGGNAGDERWGRAELSPWGLSGVFLARIADEEAGVRLLQWLERYLVIAGHDVRIRSEGEARIYTLEVAGGALLRWSVCGATLFVGTPERADETRTLCSKGGVSLFDALDDARMRRAMADGEAWAAHIAVAPLRSWLQRYEAATLKTAAPQIPVAPAVLEACEAINLRGGYRKGRFGFELGLRMR